MDWLDLVQIIADHALARGVLWLLIHLTMFWPSTIESSPRDAVGNGFEFASSSVQFGFGMRWVGPRQFELTRLKKMVRFGFSLDYKPLAA